MTTSMQKFARLIARNGWWPPLGILAVMLLVSVLEGVGIGLLFPIMNTVLSPEIIHTNTYLNATYEWLRLSNERDFTILALIAFVLFFCIKNGLSILLTYVQIRFSMLNSAQMSATLLRCYLAAPYLRHLKKDPAAAMVVINEMVTLAYNNFVLPILALTTDLFAALSIILLLMLMEPTVTVSASVILGAGIAAFYLGFRNRFRSYGFESVQVSKETLSVLRDALASVKEAKVFGVEGQFLERYRSLRERGARLVVSIETIGVAPRALIEIAAIIGLALTVITILLQDRDPKDMLAVFGMFAMAALRLLPASSRILHNLNKIRFSSPHVDEVLTELDAIEHYYDPDAAKLPVPERSLNGIAVDNLTFVYPGSEAKVIDSLSLEIRPGEIVGFAGPSGAGKSTLADIILGLLTPSAGAVLINGSKIEPAALHAAKRIGYVPQAVHLLNCSLRENIALGVPAHEIDPARIARAVRLSHLDEVVAALPQGLDTNMDDMGTRLSGGQRQRVAIARALYYEPSILIMDEATSALDNKTESEIAESIKQLSGKMTIIVIAHRTNTIRQCDRVFFIAEGRLRDTGSYDELVARNPEFQRMVRSLEGGDNAPAP